MQTTFQDHRPALAPLENRLVQAALAILAGWALLWGTLHAVRGPFRAEGVIERTFVDKFSWYPLPRFAIRMKAADGRHLTIYRLHGDCRADDRSRRSGRSCTKAEFPIGARIEVEGETIRRQDLCRSAGTRYRCGPSVLDHISAIRVNGVEVASGWSGPFNIAALCLLCAIAIAWLATNDWQIRTVTWYGLVGCVLAVQACLLVF